MVDREFLGDSVGLGGCGVAVVRRRSSGITRPVLAGGKRRFLGICGVSGGLGSLAGYDVAVVRRRSSGAVWGYGVACRGVVDREILVGLVPRLSQGMRG